MSAAWKRAHPVGAAMQRKRYHARLRHGAIVAYGGRCVDCGDTFEDHLEFDHEDGGGNKHREEIFGLGANSPGGWMFCLWLKKQGYPQDLGLALRCKDCHDLKHGRVKKPAAPEPVASPRPQYAVACSEAEAIW